MRTLKTLLVAVAVLAATGSLAAPKSGGAKYGSAGCGLGSLAFQNQPGGIQIIAATLNGTSGNQTFGITSGTSNCEPGLLAQGTKNFVDANREVLAKDAARGEGEAIGALAVLNQCKDMKAVGAALQRDYATIFPSENTTNEAVTDALLKTLHSDPSLGCGQG
ncbi:MAG TPA: DUF3015 family protein [Anaeromyxobacter sp.]